MTLIKTPNVAELKTDRTSAKWAGCDTDVLPMFIAEMDFESDDRIKAALIKQIERSDLGYAHTIAPVAEAFAGFAAKRWGWHPEPEFFYSAPDVSFGVKAALRHFVPRGSRVILTTPIYNSFFGYLKDLGLELVEIPLIETSTGAKIDVEKIAAAFSAPEDQRAHAIILSNPHNPHGVVHEKADLEALARASRDSGALIISDEIHAPLVHDPKEFSPFAPIAEAAGATAVVVTSASKGWNIAGTKCAIVYAPPATTPDDFREYLDTALGYSSSLLGRTASTVAFAECSDWLDAAIAKVQQNAEDLSALLAEHLPGAKYTPPRASYLAWIDLREAGLGENPAETILEKARIQVSDGTLFGQNGSGFVRLNLGCENEVLRDAIKRIGQIKLQDHKG